MISAKQVDDVVRAILADIVRRNEIGGVWREMEADVQKAIMDEWRELVRNRIGQPNKPSNNEKLKLELRCDLDEWLEGQIKDQPDGELGEEASFTVRMHREGICHDDNDKAEEQWAWTITQSREKSQF